MELVGRKKRTSQPITLESVDRGFVCLGLVRCGYNFHLYEQIATLLPKFSLLEAV